MDRTVFGLMVFANSFYFLFISANRMETSAMRRVTLAAKKTQFIFIKEINFSELGLRHCMQFRVP